MAAVAVTHESQVGEARRAATRVAAHAGLPAARAAVVALLATEMAANLARHAQQGELLVQARTVDGRPMVELISVDSGPGIPQVDRCLSDGYSTGGTLGAGLGTLRRMADTFDIYSRRDWGTLLVARVGDGEPPSSPSGFEWACISVPERHETVCGDSWCVEDRDASLRLMVADGLGHGPLAAEASLAAGRVFAESGSADAQDYMARAHSALRSTRGAAISVARGSVAERRVEFAGVGNVSGAIVGAQAHVAMVTHGGTVGASLPRVQVFEYEWPEQALIVLHSDGIRTRWSLRDYPGIHARHPALVAAAIYKDFRRDNDDVTVLVAGRVSS